MRRAVRRPHLVRHADAALPAGHLHSLAIFLRERGASMVTVGPIEYVFAADNPLFEALTARLG